MHAEEGAKSKLSLLQLLKSFPFQRYFGKQAKPAHPSHPTYIKKKALFVFFIDTVAWKRQRMWTDTEKDFDFQVSGEK